MPRSKWHVKHQHTHTHTNANLHIYRNICAGYVKTFIVVCRILDRQRKKEREREASANAKYGVPHATCILSPTPPRLSWSCQLLQVQLMPAARPALSHFVYPLNNELWAPGLGHVMADNLHRPREKCNFRKEAAKKYNVTKCAMC